MATLRDLDIDYRRDKLIDFESMSGSDTIIVLEFPVFTGSGSYHSVFLKLNSVVSLSWSVYRAKIPVTTLGNTTIQGFGLGTKTVAGHIIKTLTYADELSRAVSYYSQLAIQYSKDNYQIGLGAKTQLILDNKYQISQRVFDSLMKDDLVPFNIHTFSISEYSGRMIKDSIYGCTIINTGQVQSVENLITENTIAFVAKSLEQGVDITNTPIDSVIPKVSRPQTLTELLAQNKK